MGLGPIRGSHFCRRRRERLIGKPFRFFFCVELGVGAVESDGFWLYMVPCSKLPRFLSVEFVEAATRRTLRAAVDRADILRRYGSGEKVKRVHFCMPRAVV